MLQFALTLSPKSWLTNRGDAATHTLEQARLADQAGVATLWLTEDPEAWDAFAMTGAIARETSRIHLGSGVTNPYLRHPNLIAASVATLDHLSRGRAFLGLGRGQDEWYRDVFGLEVGSGSTALRETVDLLRQWWRPPHIARIDGQFTVRDWERTIVPLQPPPGPPIYIAATGPKTVALAGAIADGVRFNELASPEFLAGSIRIAREAAVAAGRDPAALRFFANPSLTITDDIDAALERKKATVATIHTLPGMSRQLEAPGFDVPAIIAEVRRQMRTNEVLSRGGGFPDLRRAGNLEAAKREIPLALMDHVAIVGPLSRVRPRLAQLGQLGVTDCFISLPSELSPHALADWLAALQTPEG